MKNIQEIIKTAEYDFLRMDGHLKDKLMFLVFGGSHAYGTSMAESDVDIRGCAFNSSAEMKGRYAVVINLPDDVKFIIDTLESGGFEAYAVGGCIRDSIMGKLPYDWDVCTSALPEQTIETFAGQHIIETGLKHGTVTLMLNGNPYEITTFRTDGKYTDNRRPDKVKFVNVLKRDLARRDFTINSLAYNPKPGSKHK